MRLFDTIIAKTPCCGKTVHLTYDGATQWTRLCLGCRKRYVTSSRSPAN